MKTSLNWMMMLLACTALLWTTGCDSDGGDDGEDAGSTAGDMMAGEVAGEEPAGMIAGTDAGIEAGMVAGMIAGDEPPVTVCDQYCDVVMMNCVDENAQFDNRDACMEFCAELPEGEEGAMSGNSAQCRLYHGGDPAALDPSVHCGHAGPDGDGVCVDATLCDTYCDTVMMNCTGGNAQFESRDSCLAFCIELEEGAEGDSSGNTVNCRLYHGGDPSALDPDFHCAHAGREGGQVCIDDPPNPCNRFCANVIESCTGDFAVYDGVDDCLTACEGYSQEGNFGDSSGDTLQCRDRHAQLAFDDPVLCLAAATDGGGICVADDAPIQLDRMGRPAINTALILSEHKDLYNSASQDRGAFFVPEMAALLEVIDGLDGDLTNGLASLFGDTPDFVALADFLSADVLLFNAGINNCEDGYLAAEVTALLGGEQVACGGRTLAQDVMDLTLQVLVDVSFVNGNDFTVVSDAVNENDLSFSSDFPYLAAPH